MVAEGSPVRCVRLSYSSVTEVQDAESQLLSAPRADRMRPLTSQVVRKTTLAVTAFGMAVFALRGIQWVTPSTQKVQRIAEYEEGSGTSNGVILSRDGGCLHVDGEKGSEVFMHPCDDGESSAPTWTGDERTGQIRYGEHLCLDAGGDTVHLWDCDLTSGMQKWAHDRVTGALSINGTAKCLDTPSAGEGERGKVSLKPCMGGNVPRQRWSLGGFAAQVLEHDSAQCLVGDVGLPTMVACDRVGPWLYDSETGMLRRGNRCLDAGGRVHMWACGNANIAQRWRFTDDGQLSSEGKCLVLGSAGQLDTESCSGKGTKWKLTNDIPSISAMTTTEMKSMTTTPVSVPEVTMTTTTQGPPPTGPESCSWEGDDCRSTACCRRAGFKCFKKNDEWASCNTECADGWDCTVLGTSPPEKIAPQVPKDKAAGTSLFCFMVVTQNGYVPPGVAAGYENGLVDGLRKNKLGIFACEGNKVYEGGHSDVGEWRSISNVLVFIKVWDQVKGDGLYAQHDWTVKVDADAVFMPDRLRMHLSNLRPPADKPVYLQNIDFKWKFMGALEVLSKEAVNAFAENKGKCADHISTNGGEDRFTAECLDAAGSWHMTDFALLNDKYSLPPEFPLNLNDVSRCTDQANVAYHPYKEFGSWMGCYNVTTQQISMDDLPLCSKRTHEQRACKL
mmetsp:Transcript_72034/g.185810  ORF Transcript_72034/g.185810 Transcript_72034/m.185810 type:complete len:673 (+) Transcript_72034:69-2087(+)